MFNVDGTFIDAVGDVCKLYRLTPNGIRLTGDGGIALTNEQAVQLGRKLIEMGTVTLTFNEAATLMNAGKKVRHESWKPGDYVSGWRDVFIVTFDDDKYKTGWSEVI